LNIVYVQFNFHRHVEKYKQNGEKSAEGEAFSVAFFLFVLCIFVNNDGQTNDRNV
jgi:hypothetical protein